VCTTRVGNNHQQKVHIQKIGKQNYLKTTQTKWFERASYILLWSLMLCEDDPCIY